MTVSTRPVLLCADDYAIAPGVSRAILDLIGMGRLSATSCMVVSRFWPEHAAWLKPLAGQVDIGLHFTLTDVEPAGPMPSLARAGRLPAMGALLTRALLRRLDAAEIEAELRRQLGRFEAQLGRPPDFIDGHQHVHQLPGIRDAVIRAFKTRLPTTSYLRVCDEPAGAILRRGVAVRRALAISALGRGLRREAAANGIRANARFAGVRDFNEAAYRTLFQQYLHGAPAGLLVMCHPGRADAALAAADWVTKQRDDEYDYFRSQAFAEDLAASGVAISRFDRLGSCGRETSSAAD